jgi:hypothetical protein
MATITITVTVSNPGSGNKYYLDGVLQATYVATPGNTYKFDQADGSNSGHPLRLSITSDGTHNSGSAYTTGVTTSGTPGSAGAYTQIEVTATTVQALYYYCTAHSGMGGSFNTGSSETVQYQDREGFNIQNLTADPDNANSVGQIYYNSTSGSFKGVVSDSTGSWSSGGTMNSARTGIGSWGTQTAALAASGEAGPPWVQPTAVESYNGSSWTETTELSTGRYLGGSLGQTSTAALYASGYTSTYTTAVEQWNGSSWTEKAEMNNPSYSLSGGVGTSTSGLAVGGNRNPAVPPSPGGNSALVEEWNGSGWTNIAELNTGRAGPGATGSTNTAGLAVGGNPAPANGNKVESWDGSSWTEIAELNSGRGQGAASGVQTLAVLSGGESPAPDGAKTEYWDGTSWTEMADMAVTRNGNVSGTSQSANSALAFGSPVASVSTTEEWVKNDFIVKTLTTS